MANSETMADYRCKVKLEDVLRNTSVRGILRDALVTLVSVQWFGSEAIELTDKTPSGRVANELLCRHSEPRLEVAEQRADGSLRREILDASIALKYAEIMITTITGKNQVTLPADIVKALELAPGTQLEWVIGPDRTLIATPLPTRARLAADLMGAGRKYLRPGSDPVRDLIAERAEEAEEAEDARSPGT